MYINSKANFISELGLFQKFGIYYLIFIMGNFRHKQWNDNSFLEQLKIWSVRNNLEQYNFNYIRLYMQIVCALIS